MQVALASGLSATVVLEPAWAAGNDIDAPTATTPTTTRAVLPIAQMTEGMLGRAPWAKLGLN